MFYTYLLTHSPTGLKYYGVRYAKDANPSDLWVTYFSSSKSVKKLIEEFGKESFYFEVRKVFPDADKAIAWEDKVLRRLKVPHNNEYLNVCRGHPPSQEEKEKAFERIYGAKYPSLVPELLEKIKQVVTEKYGGWGNASEIIKARGQKTLEDRYGVSSSWNIPGVVDKSKQTRIERYGVEWSMQNPEILHKNKETQFNKFGNWRFTFPDVKENIKNTTQSRYGVDHVFDDRELMKSKMIEKYGTDNWMKTEQGKESVREAWKKREPIMCPHCGLSSTSYSSMKRFHFDKCKKAS